MKASSTRADGFVDDVLRARAGEVPGYRSIDLLLIDGKRAPFAGLGMDGKILNDYNAVKNSFAQGPLSKMMTGAAGYFKSWSLPSALCFTSPAKSFERLAYSFFEFSEKFAGPCSKRTVKTKVEPRKMANQKIVRMRAMMEKVAWS